MRRLAALTLVLAACGGGSEPAATTALPPTSAPPTAATTAPPTTAAPTTIAGPVKTTTTAAAPPTTAAAAGWELLAEGGPEARSNPVLVADPTTGVVYLHGGRSGGTPRADLWAFDPATGWSEIVVDGPQPAPRFNHAAVWDARGRMILTTGQGGPGEFFSDVWSFDPTVGAWEMLAADGEGPANRYGTCAGYDAAGDRVLITHGFTDFGRFDDTWAFSLADGTWTEISPDGDRPVERCLHACAYDDATASLVLFGGQTNGVSHLGDTWALEDGAWREIADDAPGDLKFPSLTTVDGTAVMFGGTSADGAVDGTFAFTGDGWADVASADGPSARHSHGAAAAPGALYVFGGDDGSGDLGDLWVLRSPVT